MKSRELLLMGALVAAAGYGAWMALNVSRLRSELSTLQAAHLRLQENHRQMRHAFLELAAHPDAGDEGFRKVVAVLESDGGADIINPSDPRWERWGTTRINKTSGIQIR